MCVTPPQVVRDYENFAREATYKSTYWKKHKTAPPLRTKDELKQLVSDDDVADWVVELLIMKASNLTLPALLDKLEATPEGRKMTSAWKNKTMEEIRCSLASNRAISELLAR